MSSPSSSPTSSQSEAGESGSPGPSHTRPKEYFVSSAVIRAQSKLSVKALHKFVRGGDGYEVSVPTSDESVASGRSSTTDGHFFYFYRDVITRLGLQFPFSTFQENLLRHLHLAPSQLHPNGWAFAMAFENYCRQHQLTCSVPVFCSFFCPLEIGLTSEDEKTWYGWTSLRACPGLKYLKPFSDSWKGFKTSFFKVVSQPGELCWFLQSSPTGEAEGRFPLYWEDTHHKFAAKDFLPAPSQFSESEEATIVTLTELANRKGALVNSADYIFSSNKSQPISGMLIFGAWSL